MNEISRCFFHNQTTTCWNCHNITNFIGHNLTIIVIQNLFFIGWYWIDTDVVYLLVLFEHQCNVHYFDTNVIYLFILFRHKCYTSINVEYTQKLCTQLSCWNNVWHSCLSNTHPWNNIFHTNLKETHVAYIFVLKSPKPPPLQVCQW